MATLTENGLVIRRYPELFQAIKNKLIEDVYTGISVEEDIFLGQIVQILSNEYAALEEVLLALNDSLDRDKAAGAALDRLVYLLGDSRNAATPSAGNVEFLLEEGVTVPQGTTVENPSTGDTFSATTSITATQGKHKFILYEVSSVLNSTEYLVTVNGVDHTYTSDVDATESEIVTGLSNAIMAVSSSVYAAQPFIIDGTTYLKIVSIDTVTDISTNVLQYLTPYQIKVSVPFEADEVGAIKAPVNTVTRLVSGVGGVFSLSNDISFGVGRLRETDTELRTRVSQVTNTVQGLTYSGMYSSLINIDEVSNVTLLVNGSNATDVNGLPPHSFEAIVDAPDTAAINTKIATVIWEGKPIGIEEYADPNVATKTEVTITDDNGQPRTIEFSRPEDIFIALRFTYTLDDESELPANVSDVIKALAVAYGQTLTSGKDVNTQKFSSYVFLNTTGMDSIVCEAQTLASEGAAPDGGSWSTSNIPISPRQTAQFKTASVTVVGP